MMGRFVCRDPIEESGGINLYAFVRNDALNKLDYLGLDAIGFLNCGWSGQIMMEQMARASMMAESQRMADAEVAKERAAGASADRPSQTNSGGLGAYTVNYNPITGVTTGSVDGRTVSYSTPIGVLLTQDQTNGNWNSSFEFGRVVREFVAPNNEAPTAVAATGPNWGQFGRGAISFVSGVIGAVITVAATPLSVTGIGALGVVAIGSGSAGLITYGIGNMVAAFSPDRVRAELMASAPTSIPTGIARLIGGRRAQDAVAFGESVLNFSQGMARTGTMVPNLVTRQDRLENTKNFVEMIDALGEVAKPKEP